MSMGRPQGVRPEVQGRGAGVRERIFSRILNIDTNNSRCPMNKNNNSKKKNSKKKSFPNWLLALRLARLASYVYVDDRWWQALDAVVHWLLLLMS